ncbi:unnamed protein product [Notodromas monacha]|uniref:Uncharacterized protein n=1 Tax=Notodromas monacha TaxID=399045 RepID=A0A7R9BQS0_9CRUS|nr:unnamed protein product [Notodromas monacha]CAG0919031.1 unnamed protein product [Notodromas monacha]
MLLLLVWFLLLLLLLFVVVLVMVVVVVVVFMPRAFYELSFWQKTAAACSSRSIRQESAVGFRRPAAQLTSFGASSRPRSGRLSTRRIKRIGKTKEKQKAQQRLPGIGGYDVAGARVMVSPAEGKKGHVMAGWDKMLGNSGGGMLLENDPMADVDGDPYVAVTKMQSERFGKGFSLNPPPMDQEYMRELLHSGLPHLDRPHGYPGAGKNMDDHWAVLMCFLYAVLFVTCCGFALISWKFQKNRNEAWDCEQKIEWDTELGKEEEGGEGEEGGGEGLEAGGKQLLMKHTAAVELIGCLQIFQGNSAIFINSCHKIRKHSFY